jgi:hypothetical protein
MPSYLARYLARFASGLRASGLRAKGCTRLLAPALIALLWLCLGVAPAVQGAAPPPLCRFGINVSSVTGATRLVDDFDIAPLRAGWFVDYRATLSPPANNGAQHVKVIRVRESGPDGYRYSPSGATLDAIIAQAPGAIYIIGNEPDRRKLQDDMRPHLYAQLYHAAYTQIKGQDPTAQIWAGAIVQPTPLRLLYLDQVLAAYHARYQNAMPVDGWAIHSFILNERSCDHYNNDLNVCWGAEIPPGIDASDGLIVLPEDNARLDLFAQGIERFRAWMHARGYRNVPLYVTEYGVLMPPVFGFPPAVVNDYMQASFAYMLAQRDPQLGYPADDNRLVQRFAWFSTVDPEFNGHLYQSTSGTDPMAPPFVLSPMGAAYRDYTAAQPEESDLVLVKLELLSGSPMQLAATVGNSGNRLTATQATVRFFVGETLQKRVQIGQAQRIALAGCGATVQLKVPWPEGEALHEGTGPRLRLIWAEVDGADFPDLDLANNQLVQAILLNPHRLLIPRVGQPLP